MVSMGKTSIRRSDANCPGWREQADGRRCASPARKHRVPELPRGREGSSAMLSAPCCLREGGPHPGCGPRQVLRGCRLQAGPVNRLPCRASERRSRVAAEIRVLARKKWGPIRSGTAALRHSRVAAQPRCGVARLRQGLVRRNLALMRCFFSLKSVYSRMMRRNPAGPFGAPAARGAVRGSFLPGSLRVTSVRDRVATS